jgi:hypothetical protein
MIHRTVLLDMGYSSSSKCPLIARPLDPFLQSGTVAKKLPGGDRELFNNCMSSTRKPRLLPNRHFADIDEYAQHKS